MPVKANVSGTPRTDLEQRVWDMLASVADPHDARPAGGPRDESAAAVRLGLRIREARLEKFGRERGSQQSFAEAIGVTPRAVRHYEKGRRGPRGETMNRIIAVTGKPRAWFYPDDPLSDQDLRSRVEELQSGIDQIREQIRRRDAG